MAKATLHKIAWSVLIAGCGMMTSPMAAAQETSVSNETRDLIQGPLRLEESAQGPAISGLSLGSDWVDTSFSDFSVLREGASRYGRIALRSHDSVLFDSPLSAFDGDRTVIGSAAGGLVSVSIYDPVLDDSPFSRFTPDHVEVNGLTLTGTTRSSDANVAFLYESGFDSGGPVDGLDFSLKQRTAVSFDSDGGRAYETGASVRLGQYLNSAPDTPAWWFFAGADRQALMYDPRQGFDVRDALVMDQYALVGDAQAGVALRAFGADLSLAYIHRETTFSLPTHSWDTAEGFAAFTFTIRR